MAVSWQEMLLQGSTIESVARRILVVHPVLDFENVFSAARPMQMIHQMADELGLDPEAGVAVRITGNPALNYEEMLGIVWEIGIGGVICFFVVTAVLFLALRSAPIVVGCVVSLLTGLVWTGAFAALAIGHLNIVSMAFGVLFIGLGVDFGIHLGMSYGDLLQHGCSHDEAMRGSAKGVGSSLLICALTTAVGFFVFVPTQYLGIAELGLIAGAGMFIILFHTMTLFPALLTSVLRVNPISIANTEAVLGVDPQTAGVAVNLVGFAQAIRDWFRQALISAISVIWILLWILWRRLTRVMLATAPLLLSSLLICAMMVVLDLPFQFANVIVIPLLLGIGVDSGIHLVHRDEKQTREKYRQVDGDPHRKSCFLQCAHDDHQLRYADLFGSQRPFEPRGSVDWRHGPDRFYQPGHSARTARASPGAKLTEHGSQQSRLPPVEIAPNKGERSLLDDEGATSAIQNVMRRSCARIEP